jgi:hypothetical protein
LSSVAHRSTSSRERVAAVLQLLFATARLTKDLPNGNRFAPHWSMAFTTNLFGFRANNI